MESLHFLQDLAVVMTVSAVIVLLCHISRIPLVLGYIVAGFIIGPYTPPSLLVTDMASIKTLAELGIIFLLFSVGMEFNGSRLMRLGAVSCFVALFEIVAMIGLGFTVGHLMGWRLVDSLFLGAMLSISSTTIIAKVLMDTKKLQEKWAQLILGVLIVEDIVAIMMIAALSGFALTGSFSLAQSWWAFVKVGLFMIGVLGLGFLLVPLLFKYIKRFHSSETTIITTLGLCFGVAFVAGKIGISVALGSFLVGVVMAETDQAQEIRKKIEPLRDMFTAIFFVSVGMLIQPHLIVGHVWIIVAVSLVTVLGKILSCTIAALITGKPLSVALKIGLGLAQIGEFSFIMAQLGEGMQITSPVLFPVVVSVSAITTLTTPILVRKADLYVAFLSRFKKA